MTHPSSRRTTGRRVCLPALGMFLVGLAGAQETRPVSSTRAAVEELPAETLSLLSSLEDFSYEFDQPGYYAVLAFVKTGSRPPGFACPPVVVADWRDLLERPSEFRGRPVTVEGWVGRNKDPYTHPRHRELGQVWQVELRRPDQAITCTIICTNDVSDLPLNAQVRVTGYFVKINRYPTKSGSPGLAALIVAPGPTEVVLSRPVAPPGGGLDWRWLVGAIVAALAITVYLLAWTRRGGRREVASLHARQAAPISLADDLAKWADRELPGRQANDHSAPS